MDRPPTSVRLAEPVDLPLVASLMHESFVEYKSSYTDEAFAATTPKADQLARRMAEGPMWVATRDDVLLGTVSALPLGDELYIRGMAVLPEARGLGVGVLLLKTIEEFALAHHYQRLALSTTPFLLRAIRLYERFGFKQISDGPHDLFGTPLFTMTKELVKMARFND